MDIVAYVLLVGLGRGQKGRDLIGDL